MKKTVLLLGGNYVQMTATLSAKRLGYHVISVDYLPNNPAHRYADEYYNVSTIDKEAVLKLAQEKRIDGIVSYASDVSAPTAAFVAEKMNLPTNPYESVMVLTHKDLFRTFLRKNGFKMPLGETFSQKEEADAFISKARFPLIVKPIDSSGSKGVTKVLSKSQFDSAWEEALQYSREKKVIVEEFIEKVGYQIDGDIFVIDGKIRFWGICDQHHDLGCAPYTPIGLSYPPTQNLEIQERARRLIEQILSLLHMTIGAYNIEYIVDQFGEVYILEIGPRNGGNMITDAIFEATGVNLAEYTIKQACGDNVEDLSQVVPNKCACSYVLHSLKGGRFKNISIDERLKSHVVKMGLTVNEGDIIEAFRNASFGIGMMILSFEDVKEMCDVLDHMNDYIQVNVSE